MKSLLSLGLAAIVAAGSLTAAAPVAADDHFRGGERGYGERGYRDHDNATGALIAGGIAGLALGAALSGSHNHYSGQAYYGPAYYDQGEYDPYAYPPGYYGVCVSHRRVWDGYRGVWLIRSVRYAC